MFFEAVAMELKSNRLHFIIRKSDYLFVTPIKSSDEDVDTFTPLHYGGKYCTFYFTFI